MLCFVICQTIFLNMYYFCSSHKDLAQMRIFFFLVLMKETRKMAGLMRRLSRAFGKLLEERKRKEYRLRRRNIKERV